MSSSAPALHRAAHVALRHRIGSLLLDIDLQVTAPWTVLFGPSGSGKSTILRALAGFVKPAQGRIEVGGQLVADSRLSVWVPAHQRGIRWAGQRAALFPRMTVAENLAFGLPSHATVERALHAFHLTDLARRKAHELSGGEKQRVSVARAAAGAANRLLLLDEPFAGLDLAVRDQLIQDLKQWIGDAPVISVTHDVGEAFLLDAEVVQIGEGKVVAQGPVQTVLDPQRRRLMDVLGKSC